MAELNFIVGLDNTKLRQEADETQRILSGIGNRAVQEGQRVDTTINSLTRGLAALGVAFSAGTFIRNIVQIRGEFQQLGIAFETMLGSRLRAEELMAQIRDLALNTPYSVSEIATNTRQLIAMGIAAEDVVETMRALGDVAAGVSVPIQRIAINYGQVASLGRLQSRELRDFALAGVPLLATLADILGETTARVQEMITAGEIGFPLVEEAFKRMSGEGGQFENLMEQLTGSITGQLNRLQDSFELMANQIGESTEGIIYGTIDVLATLIENYETVGRVLLSLVAGYGAYRAALAATIVLERARNIIATIQGFNNMTTALRRTTQAQILLNQAIGANPFIKIASALVTVGGLLWAFSDRTEEATDNTIGLGRASRNASEAFNNEASRVRYLDGIVRDSNLNYQSRRKAIDELRQIIPGYNALLSEEGRLITNNTSAIEEYLNQLERQIRLKSVEDELIEAYREENRLLKERNDAYDEFNRKRTNSAYYDQPIISLGTSELEQAEERLNEADASLNNIRGTIQELRKDFEQTTTAFQNLSEPQTTTLQQQIQAARNSVRDLTNDLQRLRNGETPSIDYVTDISGAEKALKEAQDNLNTLLGVNPKAVQQTTDTALKTYDNYIKAREDLEQNAIKARADVERAALQTDEQRRAFDLRQRLAAIDVEQRAYQRELEKINSERRKQNIQPIDINQDDYLFDQLRQAAYDAEVQANFNAQSQILRDNETFASQRTRLIADNLRVTNELYAQGRTQEAEQAERQLRERLNAINLEEFQLNIDWSLVFGDLTTVSERALLDVRENIEGFLDNLDPRLDVETFKIVSDALRDVNTQLANISPIQELRAGLESLYSTTERVTAAQIEYNRVMSDGNSTTEEMEAATKELSDAERQRSATLSRINRATNALGSQVGQVVDAGNSVVGLLEAVGVEVPAALQGALDGIGQIAGALESIDITKPFSIISSSVGVLTGAANAIGSLFGGSRNMVSQDQINSYNRLSETINRVISSQREMLQSLSGPEAVEQYQESLRLLEINRRAAEKIGRDILNSGASGTTHSFGVRQMRRLERYRKDIEALGIDFNSFGGRGTGIFDLSPEQLRLLRDQLPEAWKELNGDVANYLENIIEADEETKQLTLDLQEALTGLSFDGARNGLQNLLSDVNTTFEDVASNFEGYMRDAILNTIINRQINDRIASWYEDFADAFTDGTLSSEERENLQNIYKNIYQDAADMRDAAYEAAGLDPNGGDDRTGIQTGIATASQDSIDELNGRFTVIQGHTFQLVNTTTELLERARMNTINANQLLNQVNSIRLNTNRLEAIEDVLTDISVRGIQIRN